MKTLEFLNQPLEIIDMKLFVVLFFIGSYSGVFAKNVDSRLPCDSYDLTSVKTRLDNIILNKDFERLDHIIELITCVDAEKPLKDNLLGIAYMFKSDPSSLVMAKNHLESALNNGVKAAAHNLAELHFLEDDYVNTVRYLDIVDAFNYEFPDKKYVDWARLQAQVKYLTSENSSFIEDAVNLFMEIQSIDESGTSEYFLGHYELNEGQNVNLAIEFLNRAIDKKNITAMLLLADAFYVGEKVEKNIDKAKTLYLLAGETGSGRAYYNLSVIAHDESDISSMKVYLTQSANLGYPKAISLYRELTKAD